jgi:hypothetical protein
VVLDHLSLNQRPRHSAHFGQALRTAQCAPRCRA